MSSTPTTQLSTRAIDRVVGGPRPHWVGDGFRVRGYFSTDHELTRLLSPFILLDYHEPFTYEANADHRRGVGWHPHRGFETVTVAFSGAVAHRDSAGNSGIVQPGDVQWMTAASGILHEEYHEEHFAREGGVMHMLQLWVNLPAAHKFAAPGYQHLAAASIPHVEPVSGAELRLIAGEYQGVQGAARTTTPINLFEGRAKAYAHFTLTLPATHNAAILVMSGELMMNRNQTLSSNDFVVFAHNGEDTIDILPTADAHFVVFSGEPIHEPVVQYGPFVMNTKAEIQQAFTDFEHGKFGRPLP